MSGRVLTSSAIVDIATDRSVYGRAFWWRPADGVVGGDQTQPDVRGPGPRDTRIPANHVEALRRVTSVPEAHLA